MKNSLFSADSRPIHYEGLPVWRRVPAVHDERLLAHGDSEERLFKEQVEQPNLRSHHSSPVPVSSHHAINEMTMIIDDWNGTKSK